jgi:hypothetical protein
VCPLFAACVGSAPARAALISSGGLWGEGAASLGGGVTTSAPAAPDPLKMGSSGASVSAGKVENDDWFNVIVFGWRPETAGDMPSPSLNTGPTTRPSTLAGRRGTLSFVLGAHEDALFDWTTPLLRISLDEMTRPSVGPVNLITPEIAQPLPISGSK